MKNKSEPILTIPNIISLSRLLLSTVFLYLILARKTREAFIIFIIAISTDFFDGAAARIFKQKSNLGALLDSLGDKVLMTLSFIVLSIPSISSPNIIPIWLTAVVIGRDIYIVSGALMAFRLIGRKKFPPTITGKISTVFQMAVPPSILFFNMIHMQSKFLLPLFLFTLIITIISGIHYTCIGIKWLNESKSEANKRK
ncbi:MAG: CDP-alcohol phosphatidyltransferase family protein [Acidobacteriota bacterium]